MIWFIIFILIFGHFNQFDCASESRKNNNSQTEFIDTYYYEVTPFINLNGSQLIHPIIHDSKGILKRSNITDNQPGIPFHLIIRLVNARTSRPLVGAYIYVWHANIHGNHSSLNQVRRFKRLSNKDYQEFQDNPDRLLNFNHEPDSRQNHKRKSRSFFPSNERTRDYESRNFDQPKNHGPFKSPEFHGSPNRYRNSYLTLYNQSYVNSSIEYSKLANSSYNFNDYGSFSSNNSCDSENFTVPGNETTIYQESTPKYWIFENFTQPNTETYTFNVTPFTTESFTNQTETNSQDFQSTMEPYWNLTESDTNNTEVTDATSKVNDTVETDGPKHDANEARIHFLQGYQITNFNGDVSFITIVPGWIANRSLHVNVHVYLDESQEDATFVGQLYFPNEIADELFNIPLYYEANRRKLTKNYEDKVFKLNNGNSTLLTLETIGSGYQSIITLGIDPLKTIKP